MILFIVMYVIATAAVLLVLSDMSPTAVTSLRSFGFALLWPLIGLVMICVLIVLSYEQAVRLMTILIGRKSK